MSSHFTVANIKYVARETLKNWVLQGHTNLGSNFLIIDVRDSDYVGGHIIHSLHIQSSDFKNQNSLKTLNYVLSQMIMRKADTIVFHCMLSQQRGPSSSMRFMRFLNEKKDMLQNTENESDIATLEFIDNIKICVLQGGFSKWQDLYGEDPKLTESYQKDIWKFGSY